MIRQRCTIAPRTLRVPGRSGDAPDRSAHAADPEGLLPLRAGDGGCAFDQVVVRLLTKLRSPRIAAPGVMVHASRHGSGRLNADPFFDVSRNASCLQPSRDENHTFLT